MLDHLLGSRHHLDEAGRALGEQSSVPTPDHELVPCPFAGVRRGGRMNRGALAQVQGHHDELVRLVDGLWGPPTVAGAWTRCAHLTLTAMAHPPPVPVRLAAAFKTFLGFRQVLGALLLTHPDLSSTPLGSLGTGHDFVGMLERERWLVGRHQVCAGSPAVIASWFDRLAVEGTGATDPRPKAEAAAAVVALTAAHQHRARHDLPHTSRWLVEDDPLCRLSRHRPGVRPTDLAEFVPDSRALAELIAPWDDPTLAPAALTAQAAAFIAARCP